MEVKPLAKKQVSDAADSALSRFQMGETMTINRSELKEAAYNPRIIDDDALKRLRQGIQKHGLIGAAIVWNKRTGTVVSGHQRLKALDVLERRADYDLQVTVIDVSEREEKALNVQLNNPSMQGDWDIDKLGVLFEVDELTAEELGFTPFDVDLMFGGDERFSELFNDTEEVTATKEQINKVREHRSEMMEQMKKDQSGDFYFTVVCESQEDKDEMLRKMSLPVSEMFVSSQHLRRLERKT